MLDKVKRYKFNDNILENRLLKDAILDEYKNQKVKTKRGIK